MSLSLPSPLLLLIACMATCVHPRLVHMFPGSLLVDPSKCPPRPVPAPTFSLIESSSLSALVDFFRHNTTQRAFVFASGNKAMNSMALNWAASIYSLGSRSFQFVMVPLDHAGAEELRKSAYIPLFHDEVALQRFAAHEGMFGTPNYKAMARYKWELAKRVLDEDTVTVWSDPDIVMFRNPLSYLDNLPECDIILQGEMGALGILDTVFGADKMTPQRGLSHYSGGNEQAFFNTGFVMVRPSAGGKRIVDHMLATFAELDRQNSTHHDDQEIFNSIIMHQYELVGSTHKRPAQRNEFWLKEMSQGRCLRYKNTVHNYEVSAWILNPILFPLRPTHDDKAIMQSMLEPPYLKHYNWIFGAQRKIGHMVNDCNWFYANGDVVFNGA